MTELKRRPVRQLKDVGLLRFLQTIVLPGNVVSIVGSGDT